MPIRLRLALWYGAIFGVVLLLFGIVLYLFMARHLESMVEDAVGNRASHLAAAVSVANTGGPLGDTVRVPPLDDFEAPEVYVQVLDTEGTIVARSSNLQDRVLPVPDARTPGEESTVLLDGVALRETTVAVVIGGNTVARVQVAASYDQRDMVLDRLRWVLVLGGLGSMGFVVILSSTLAGRALRPVIDMTETARAIALSRGFDRRLNAGDPNDELGHLAQTFNEMLASLEEAYSAQQRFTADASHELRAPLTAIRGNLDLLDRVKEMPETERRESLARVRHEVERLSRLVNDLLALARADAGQQLRIEPVELDALLVDVHRQVLATAGGVTVSIDHIEPVVVQGDPDRLKELLLNIADNALRYTPAGGSVALRLDLELPWVIVSVADTGIGIDSDDLPHVFDRFWRADQARSRDSGGTGLGLAIARWIVDRHGGEIAVTSRPGEGTTVSIRLPASR